MEERFCIPDDRFQVIVEVGKVIDGKKMINLPFFLFGDGVQFVCRKALPFKCQEQFHP
jgi:hypothetical protein